MARKRCIYISQSIKRQPFAKIQKEIPPYLPPHLILCRKEKNNSKNAPSCTAARQVQYGIEIATPRSAMLNRFRKPKRGWRETCILLFFYVWYLVG